LAVELVDLLVVAVEVLPECRGVFGECFMLELLLSQLRLNLLVFGAVLADFKSVIADFLLQRFVLGNVVFFDAFEAIKARLLRVDFRV
jgi:hypothetical protein